MNQTRHHLAGQVLGGRYMLLSMIAQGGMGEVWKARDRETTQIVAAKVLRPELTGENASLSRFRTEANNAMRVQHPNIASVLDSGQDSGRGWIVMELVKGLPLTDFLKDGQRLPLTDLLSILYQVAMALEALANAGVVHRDIKPANILIRPDGVTKLTDFGISRSVGQETMTAAGMVMGTAQYLPPEQAMGDRATTLGDLYALGIIAYECVAGKRPFTGATQVDIAFSHVNDPVPPLPEDVPAPMVGIIMRLLEKDPKKRFQSGLILAKELAHVAQKLNLPVEPHPLQFVAKQIASQQVGAHAAPARHNMSAPAPTPDQPVRQLQRTTYSAPPDSVSNAKNVRTVQETTQTHSEDLDTRIARRQALVAKLESRAEMRRRQDGTAPQHSSAAFDTTNSRAIQWRSTSSTAYSPTSIPSVSPAPASTVSPSASPIQGRTAKVASTPRRNTAPVATRARHGQQVKSSAGLENRSNSAKSQAKPVTRKSLRHTANQQRTGARPAGGRRRQTPGWLPLNTVPTAEHPTRHSRTITKYNRSVVAPEMTRKERFGRAGVIVLVIVTLLLIALAIANRFMGDLIPSFGAVPVTAHHPEEALLWLKPWAVA